MMLALANFHIFSDFEKNYYFSLKKYIDSSADIFANDLKNLYLQY